MVRGICPFADQLANRGQLIGWSSGFVDRVGFCDHTAGGFYSTMTRAGFWNDPNGNGDTDDAVTAHFAIARDGRILQVLNIFDTAWAQGRLGPSVSWPPFAAMSRGNPNGYLISTEHEDAMTVNGRTVFAPGAEWTPAQYASDLRVKRWCVEEVRRETGKDLLRFGIDSLAGHHMFDSVNRRECPGRFWRDEYRQRLFADLKEEIMINHNAVATWWSGDDGKGRDLGASAEGEVYNVRARDDFGLPTSARRVRFAVYMQSGPGFMRFFHGSDGAEAEPVGWGTKPIVCTVEADLTSDGKVPFVIAGGHVRTSMVRCLGYV